MSCCSNPNRSTFRRCMVVSGTALSFLLLVLAFAIGLILGAYFYETFVPVLPAVIAFAAAIAAIIIALLLWYKKHD